MDLSVVPMEVLWEEVARRYKAVLLTPDNNRSAEEWKICTQYRRELWMCLVMFDEAQKRLREDLTEGKRCDS